MGNSSYISLSLATSLERSMDATAHNLSNASTAGFKAFRPVFESVSSDTESAAGDTINYVEDRGSYLDTMQGALVPTGNPLDLAITGSGWFGFETDGGNVAYGRHGQLVIDPDGRITTVTGQALLDAGGAPLVVPEGTGTVAVAADGTMTGAEGEALGQIGLFDVQFDTVLQPVGNGLYMSPLGDDAAQPSESSRISQGFVELSNVEPVVEMTRLISIQRAYEGAIRLMTEEDELTKQSIQRLGRV
ncbi:MAG: flagellar hook-basal body complex protein [Brevirhabdus sp.]